MHSVKNLQDARRVIHYLIAEIIGHKETKRRGGLICWRVEKEGWIGPRQISVTQYLPGLYRVNGGGKLGNGGDGFMRTVWPFRNGPKQESFELTFCGQDLTPQFANQLIELVNYSYAGFKNTPQLEGVEHGDNFPYSSWTILARQHSRSNTVA